MHISKNPVFENDERHFRAFVSVCSSIGLVVAIIVKLQSKQNQTPFLRQGEKT